MVITPKCQQRNPAWGCSVRGIALEEVSEFRYLGVLFTNKLLWNQHIARVLCTGRSTLESVRRVFAIRSLPIKAKRTVWTTLVRPKLEHGPQVWRCSDTEARKLESIQHQALCYCLRTNSKAKREALRCILGLPSLRLRRRQLRLKYAAKLLSKSHDTWARFLFEMEPSDRCRVVGRSQKHWQTYFTSLLNSFPELRDEWDEVRAAAQDHDGMLPMERSPEQNDDAQQTPISKWMTAVKHWCAEVERTSAVQEAETSSTLAIIARILQDAEYSIGCLPITHSKPSSANWIIC